MVATGDRLGEVRRARRSLTGGLDGQASLTLAWRGRASLGIGDAPARSPTLVDWSLAMAETGDRPKGRRRKEKIRRKNEKKKGEEKLFLGIVPRNKNFFLLLVCFPNLIPRTKVLLNTFLFFFCSPEQKNINFCYGEQKHFLTNRS